MIALAHHEVGKAMARREIDRAGDGLGQRLDDRLHGRDVEQSRTAGVGRAQHADVAHLGSGAAPGHAQTITKLARHKVRAEIRGDQQIERLRIGAIITQPNRLEPLVEHARANVAAQTGADHRPGGFEVGMCLYPCILLPIHHAYNFRHYRADPTNMPPAFGQEPATRTNPPAKAPALPSPSHPLTK